jgi:hypothetical protein
MRKSAIRMGKTAPLMLDPQVLANLTWTTERGCFSATTLFRDIQRNYKVHLLYCRGRPRLQVAKRETGNREAPTIEPDACQPFLRACGILRQLGQLFVFRARCHKPELTHFSWPIDVANVGS